MDTAGKFKNCISSIRLCFVNIALELLQHQLHTPALKASLQTRIYLPHIERKCRKRKAVRTFFLEMTWSTYVKGANSAMLTLTHEVAMQCCNAMGQCRYENNFMASFGETFTQISLLFEPENRSEFVQQVFCPI